MTLTFGLAGVLMIPAGQFSESVSIAVFLASATTLPVAIAWYLRPWTSPRLAAAYVLYADVGIVSVLFSFQTPFDAMPGCAMFAIVAAFIVIGSSYRVMLIHLGVATVTLLMLGVLAVADGADPWSAASRIVTIGSLYAAPFMIKAYIGQLRLKAARALRDPLTGLWNRRGLLDTMDTLGVSPSEAGDAVGVTVLDIDRFKQINDRFGHPSGDAVLIEVARRLSTAVADRSAVARLGGDEFVVVTTGTREEITESDNRIRAALEETFDGPRFTTSLGSAVEALDSDTSIHVLVRQLIALADIEMYRFKARTSGSAASDRLPETNSHERTRSRIDELIASGGPDIFFQPICDTVTGSVLGFEALSRFPFGAGSPLSWYRDATEAGIGPRLERAALDRALDAMCALPPGSFVSLNASADTIRTTNLLDRLRPHLASRTFHLEITEHERVDDYLALTRAIDTLRAAGVQISIDDVGAGFAGLRHVVELRPDILKVDYALVHGIDRDPLRRAAATAIIDFARQIDATVIMEGVETEAELRVASELGAQMVQGFLTGRPEPASAHSHRQVTR
ncbi:bifunctional diguanylate cyclase/phosphodiesterase [Rhodococcus sp. 15-2388-1-1a]|uniref:bifunctional diguanylate cyclase/phosphodiesterase n=1 Tax=Nocardiaceae TaxID=85025 RepID=UPI00056B31B0|nr:MULTISPECIES: bifunctional diguanylate cyclase/phosphodiesterase [Rhodococcus]OZF00279.1 bifunctional diguanylate cyclase/phosphodiesterase [Rhodococcus sp. 15-2388-1-1a]